MATRAEIWGLVLMGLFWLALFAAANGADEPIPGAAVPRPGEWPQFAGSSLRNNVVAGPPVPTDWDLETGHNVKWWAPLGSSTYNSPVVAGGRVFIGTNNGGGYIERYPASVDLGCLLCLDEQSGELLWQYSSEKLPTGRAHDWPELGLFSAPFVDGERVWLVSNRCEVVCLDAAGFHDGENDGPFRNEAEEADLEADVIWKFDVFGRLGVRPHNVTSCSVTSAGELLLVGTSNGVDETHQHVPAPEAPSFIALDRSDGRLVWQDASPGRNILHGQWSSPAYGVIDGVPQAIFAGGDGWLYSFDLREMRHGRTHLLWWFDCNPKESVWSADGTGTRNNLLATPAIVDDRVYIAVGQSPEHGDGDGRLWCLDATRRGDLSTELVYNRRDLKTPIPHKRVKACEPDRGDFTRLNPNSGVIWQYDRCDRNGDGRFEFEETLHRAKGALAIDRGLVFVADMSGLLHCVDAHDGAVAWVYDQFGNGAGSPLIVGDKVIVGDEDGDLAILEVARRRTLVSEWTLDAGVTGAPVAANGVLYVTTHRRLYAIAHP